jgi:hypothetical protein
MGKSARQRAQQRAEFARRQERLDALVVSKKKLTAKDSETILTARGIILDHFGKSISIPSEISYGNFPQFLMDMRGDEYKKIEITGANQFLRVARKLASAAKTARVTKEDREAAQTLTRKYKEYGVTIRVDRFSGPYPNGELRRPFKLSYRSPDRRGNFVNGVRTITKEFARLQDVRLYLQRNCVKEEPDKDRIDKLKVWLKLHFNKNVAIYGSHLNPPIYTLTDYRTNLGAVKNRVFYSLDELEKAALKLCEAAKYVSQERIYKHEYAIVTALNEKYDAEISVDGTHRGVTVSGAQRRPFSVKVHTEEKSRRRLFPDVESLQEYVEKNIPLKTTEDAE